MVTIYALHDSAGRVRYIGQTRYVDQRRSQHEKTWPEWTMQAVQEVAAGLADEVEQRMIAEHEAAGCLLVNVTHTGRARAHMRAVAARRPRRPARDDVGVSLRLPRALYARLKRLAARENRSLHGQIVFMLAEALAARAAAVPAAPALTQEGPT